MKLTTNMKLILRNMMDILDSNHPAVITYTPETSEGEEVCMEFCNSIDACITVKILLTENLFMLTNRTKPVIMRVYMVDWERTDTEYFSDREFFQVVVGNEVVFRVMLSNPNKAEEPYVSIYTEGPWIEDLERIRYSLERR